MTQLIPSAIPTHIITGFLGSGKTTLIKYLMSQKPEHEKWAILVNEFGEIGIDGQLLSNDSATSDQVFVKEIPGGCMCCTSGLPMQIALAQLISRSRPDRLFIEPTGLGHPKEVVQELQSEHNREVIQLMAILTLFDARKLIQDKYQAHPIFKQQLEIADILVANKADLYDETDITAMTESLERLNLQHKTRILTEQGNLDIAWLKEKSQQGALPASHHHHAHAHQPEQPLWQQALQEEGFAHTRRQKDGFITEGWIYDANHIFDFNQVFGMLSILDTERLKGVFITDRGIFGFNKAEDILSCIELDESDDSRLELIYAQSSDFAKQETIDIHAALKTRLS